MIPKDETYGCSWDWDITKKPTDEQLNKLIEGLVGTSHVVDYGTRSRSITIIGLDHKNKYYGLDGKFKVLAIFKIKPTFTQD